MKELVKIKNILMEIGQETIKRIGKDKTHKLLTSFEVQEGRFILTMMEKTIHEPESKTISIDYWIYYMYKNGKRRMFNWILTEYSSIIFEDNRKTIYICETCDTPHLLTNKVRYDRYSEWECSYCGQRSW